MVERICIVCGKKFIARKNGKGNFYRKTCSKECFHVIRVEANKKSWTDERKEYMSELFTGRDTTHWKIPQAEKKPNWKGGYSSVYFNKIAFDILKLKKVCECCGSTQQICVHHKDRDRTNNTIENLMILCKPCHTRHHNNEKEVGVNCPNGFNNRTRCTI